MRALYVAAKYGSVLFDGHSLNTGIDRQPCYFSLREKNVLDIFTLETFLLISVVTEQ